MRQALFDQEQIKSENLQALPFMASIDDYLAAFPSGSFQDYLSGEENQVDDMSVAEMRDVIDRIRMQLRFIISSVRNWHYRHEEMERPLRKKYSMYEGALCRYDLARHWALYRFAMSEYSTLFKKTG